MQIKMYTMQTSTCVLAAFALASAQDRSPFYIFNVMNEISQNPELLDTFLVVNHCHIFRKIIKSNIVNMSKKN